MHSRGASLLAATTRAGIDQISRFEDVRWCGSRNVYRTGIARLLLLEHAFRSLDPLHFSFGTQVVVGPSGVAPWFSARSFPSSSLGSGLNNLVSFRGWTWIDGPYRGFSADEKCPHSLFGRARVQQTGPQGLCSLCWHSHIC